MESRGGTVRLGIRVATSVVVLWLALCTALVVLPDVDEHAAVDATYFLSSEGGHTALENRSDLRIGEVVLSRPLSVASLPIYAVCDEPGVTCIAPSPETTQGEAEAFARLAKERGWTSVTVVSQASHVARIRILMGRCFPGMVRVVGIPEQGVKPRLRSFVYETGAMVKVVLTPGCHTRLPWAG